MTTGSVILITFGSFSTRYHSQEKNLLISCVVSLINLISSAFPTEPSSKRCFRI